MADLLKQARTLHKFDEGFSVFLVAGHAAVHQELADEDVEVLEEPNYPFLFMFFYPFDLLSQGKVEVLIHEGDLLEVQCDQHEAYLEQKTLYLGRTIFKAKFKIFED